MKISSIVAMGNNRVIGKSNELMWDIPSETAHYLNLLDSHYFIIGRKNYEGSSEKLDSSKALILTRNKNYESDANVFTSYEDAISYAKKQGENELFVIGGEEIYRLLMPIIDQLYLSIVDFDEKGDTYFPHHENFEWETEESLSFSYEKSHTPIPWSYQKLLKIKNN